ncbi:uncharacterized protein LOC132306172 isoform X2 [Cornus florida]|uniref:uncharacterized protein LOC132306172 isoform X2 n=1 Tax=Cornus florida TaxID=4283 RepID=UPI0028A28D1E|nr:uncharacterized protein LOC132306172 isoform X2 [Cornus florida]
MLDDGQGECNSRIVVDASSDRSMTWNEIGNLPEKKLSQSIMDSFCADCGILHQISCAHTSKQNGVAERKHRHLLDVARMQVDGPFFLASEDDVIGVEHLLAEPKCNDLGGSFLGFDTSSTQNCFDIEELSALECAYIKIESDVRKQPLRMHRYAGLQAYPGRERKRNTEFADEAWDPSCIPSEESYVGKLDLENQSAASGGRDCGAEMSELSTTSIPVLEDNWDQNFFLLDKMTINELNGAFRKIFGCETSNTDKQWLKGRILFGLQNLVEMDGGLSLLECHVNSNENEGKMILKARNACFIRTSSPFTSVFNFKTKPRVQNVKRGRPASCDSSNTFSSEISKDMLGSPDLGGKQNMLVTKKRLRKPTRRYIEESVEQNSRYQRRKCGISDTSSEDKILQIGSHTQNSRKVYGATPLICWEESFKGACIQVPFGIPVQKGRSKKKGRDYEDVRDSELLGSNVDSIKDFLSADSHDEISEDECITRSRIQNSKGRRKHHIFWTLSEVSKLVEGVSRYGVGRWIEIKRQQFPLSANRTAVDLKDKWRNLLRASLSRSQSKSEVQSSRMHASQSIPESILRRVRELSVIHPYPRERKNQLS